MVERVRSKLHQDTTVRPQLGTFKGWVGTPPTTVALADIAVADKLHDVLVEIGPELIYVTSYDPTTQSATCPPWFRRQNGSPANDAAPVDSRVVINPLWSHWTIAQAVVSGIDKLYPDLFAAKSTEITLTPLDERYALPADCESILNVKLQDIGPGNVQRKLGTWTVDPQGKYLHVKRPGIGGLKLKVTYRAKPVVPDPADTEAVWSDTGLPDSAADLPVFYALATLLPSAEAAKTQTASVEQSERNRFVQAGTALSAAKYWMQVFEKQLEVERRKMLSLYPPRPHFELNG